MGKLLLPKNRPVQHTIDRFIDLIITIYTLTYRCYSQCLLEMDEQNYTAASNCIQDIMLQINHQRKTLISLRIFLINSNRHDKPIREHIITELEEFVTSIKSYTAGMSYKTDINTFIRNVYTLEFRLHAKALPVLVRHILHEVIDPDDSLLLTQFMAINQEHQRSLKNLAHVLADKNTPSQGILAAVIHWFSTIFSPSPKTIDR